VFPTFPVPFPWTKWFLSTTEAVSQPNARGCGGKACRTEAGLLVVINLRLMSVLKWFKRTLGAIFPVLMLPIINDISTDLDDPPAFTKAKIGKLPDSFKPQIRKGYPDLKSLTFPKPVTFNEVYEAGKAAALKMPRCVSISHDSYQQQGGDLQLQPAFVLQHDNLFILKHLTLIALESGGIILSALMFSNCQGPVCRPKFCLEPTIVFAITAKPHRVASVIVVVAFCQDVCVWILSLGLLTA
jgi:hypothetical protein